MHCIFQQTEWGSVLLEKLLVTWLLKKFPALDESERFINACIKALNQTLSPPDECIPNPSHTLFL
jgi:hypothetical protein